MGHHWGGGGGVSGGGGGDLDDVVASRAVEEGLPPLALIPDPLGAPQSEGSTGGWLVGGMGQAIAPHIGCGVGSRFFG